MVIFDGSVRAEGMRRACSGASDLFPGHHRRARRCPPRPSCPLSRATRRPSPWSSSRRPRARGDRPRICTTVRPPVESTPSPRACPWFWGEGVIPGAGHVDGAAAPGFDGVLVLPVPLIDRFICRWPDAFPLMVKVDAPGSAVRGSFSTWEAGWPGRGAGDRQPVGPRAVALVRATASASALRLPRRGLRALCVAVRAA